MFNRCVNIIYMIDNRYIHLNKYLKDRFGERTLKVCIDGGFTCPNRDGTCGSGGCVFCGELGAGENIKNRKSDIIDSIENQVKSFLDSYRGERANKFIVYFQAFSNTYDSIENLKIRYDHALCCSDKIIGLQVATRPDCINEDVVKLLASYKDKYYVCVELGLQTANDSIGNIINRGYSTQDFINACEILHKYSIDIVGHLMVGLPNESVDDILHTSDLISKYCNGIKIHSTYILKNTRLEKMFIDGTYRPIELDYYVDCVCKIISRIDKNIVVHRINGDPPKKLLVAPEWTSHKKIVINAINKELDKRNIFQGDNKWKKL